MFSRREISSRAIEILKSRTILCGGNDDKVKILIDRLTKL